MQAVHTSMSIARESYLGRINRHGTSFCTRVEDESAAQHLNSRVLDHQVAWDVGNDRVYNGQIGCILYLYQC